MVTFRVVCCHSKSLEPIGFAWKLKFSVSVVSLDTVRGLGFESPVPTIFFNQLPAFLTQ